MARRPSGLAPSLHCWGEQGAGRRRDLAEVTDSGLLPRTFSSYHITASQRPRGYLGKRGPPLSVCAIPFGLVNIMECVFGSVWCSLTQAGAG